MIPEDSIKKCLREIKGRARQSAFHAFEHLDKAERIAELDPEMAVFRAITAEEEAATAVFFSLKQRGYDRAKKLQDRSHLFKQGLFPFLAIIGDYIGSLTPKPVVRWEVVEKDGTPRLVIKIRVPDGRWAEPVPPLNPILWSAGSGDPYHFERELQKFATETAAESTTKHLEEYANLRNQLLYASERGMPSVTGGVAETIMTQRERVSALAALVCMIAPYKEKGTFAQQCLNAFLFFMEKLGQEDLQSTDYGFVAPPLHGSSSSDTGTAEEEAEVEIDQVMASTDIGYINPQNQRVVRCVGPSPTLPGQNTYELECLREGKDGKTCRNRYGANGPDIKGAGAGTGRKCPKCQKAAPGDPL